MLLVAKLTVKTLMGIALRMRVSGSFPRLSKASGNAQIADLYSDVVTPVSHPSTLSSFGLGAKV